jgi:predicted phage terminase large subunit-like protein
VPDSWEWHPNPGPQELFHSSPAYEVFYGGAAGGGKSESLLVEALRYVHVPGYTAIIFRRTFPELRQARGLIERALTYYPKLGGRYNAQEFVWKFPSGASIRFGQMEHEKDKYDHQSAEYAFIGFDELTSFTDTQYEYLFSRARTTIIDPATKLPIQVRVRGASNPGNVGHEWVKARFIDALGPFEIKYFRRDTETDLDTLCNPSDSFALSRQFIPAKLYDNPKLQEADPGYESRLMQMSLLERERLLNGNWDILVQGNVFIPSWFKRIQESEVPSGLQWIRGWDLAASIKTKADFSASPRIAVDADANVYIANMIRMKAIWPKVRTVMKDTILNETNVKKTVIEAKAHGLAAVQELTVDPDLVGHKIEAVNVDIDKLSRALVWSSRAEQGKVKLVEGPWVDGFLLRASLFDGEGSASDDEIDAVSLIMQGLARPLFKKINFLALNGTRPTRQPLRLR